MNPNIELTCYICYHKAMEKAEFIFYERPNGRVEFEEFLNSIPRKDRIKLLSIIDKVEQHGITIGIKQKWVAVIDRNLYEIRSKIGNNQQRGLYFHINGDEYMITHGFTKKTQKTPTKEIKHAKELRAEYFSRELEQHG